ncbi:1-acyl-sn-glycerol-3-phosphate acyltransferase alpha-like [Huso huso]|uniref:1-acyl-sn-glycerol-3-phosphate acyltransferase n=1 Tax=Huso huso TaxID=61971 RepID=A0ABR0Z877_HUSHU
MSFVMLLLIMLLLIPVLLLTSRVFTYYFKNIFYVAYMMVMASIALPICILRCRGRDIENMRIVRAFCWHVKYFLGVRYKVSGLEHFQTEGPYVILCNHQSTLDILGMMEILPDRCTPIARKEVVYVGTVGLTSWIGGVVFINRKKTSDAKSVMADVAQTMQKDQIRVWVFPEGTRNQKGDLLPFKKGAFHLAVQVQVPIIPVVFSSYKNFYSPEEKQFKSGTVTIKILPKVETKNMTSDDVSALSDTCYQLMNSAFAEISQPAGQTNGPSSN